MANFTLCVLKIIIIVLMNLLAFMVYNCNFNDLQRIKDKSIKLQPDTQPYSEHKRIVEEYFNRRKNWKTSMLGSILFQNEVDYTPSTNKKYLILIWKHWSWLKNRHVYYFGEERHNPFDDCSVKNCRITGIDKWLEVADAVVVHLQRGLLPNITKRNPYQRWIFLNDEAPAHVYNQPSGAPTISDLANVFNWSMTYRTDADIPVPYGRTVALPAPEFRNASLKNIATLVPNWKVKRRDVLITVLMSHCSVRHRMKFLKYLKQYITVEVHGRCSEEYDVLCPGHFKSNCIMIDQFLFYLVLENAMCRQYMTEKLFHNAYNKGAIPVIYGPPLQDCQALLPPNSFIHVDDFLTISDMVDELIKISKDDEKILSYHLWRNNFKVINEHGYFGTKSVHLCRLCEALNYNDERPKVYGEKDIRLFFDEDILCKNVEVNSSFSESRN